MQRGLAETSGPAAPFGPCHSIGHLSCQYLSLDQENLISPCRGQHRVSHQEISKELEDRKGHSWGEEGQTQRRGSWLGRGAWVRAGCPWEQPERPSSAIGLQ